MADRQDGLGAAVRAHADHALAVSTAASPLIGMGGDLLKAIALINGGAAAATILFVGQVVRDLPWLAASLIVPLSLFGFGLAVAAFATGWSYLAQAELARGLGLRRTIGEAPFIIETRESSAASRRSGRFCGLAFVAVLVSMGSAVAGFGAAGVLLWIGLVGRAS